MIPATREIATEILEFLTISVSVKCSSQSVLLFLSTFLQLRMNIALILLVNFSLSGKAL